MVVYAANGAKPAASAIAVSDELTVAKGSAPAWRTFTFHGESLPSGTYWIGFWVSGWGSLGLDGHFYYNTVGSSTSSYYESGHTYSKTGMPSSSGWAKNIDERTSAYLDIATNGQPPPPPPPRLLLLPRRLLRRHPGSSGRTSG